MFRDLYRSAPRPGRVLCGDEAPAPQLFLVVETADGSDARAMSASPPTRPRRRKLRSARPERGQPDYLNAGGR
jgi:hypothetical protein